MERCKKSIVFNVSLVNDFLPTVNDTIGTLEYYLESDINQFISIINITLINITIVNNLLPIAILLNQTQDNITVILSKSASAMDTKSTLTSLFSSLNTSICVIFNNLGYVSVSDSINDLGANSHPIASTSYSWNKTIAIPLPLSLANNLDSIILTTSPDSTSILASLNSIDLTPFSTEITNTALNVPKNLSSTVRDSADSIILDIKQNLNNLNDTISSAAQSPLNDVNKIVSDAMRQTNNIFKNILFYDGFRYLKYFYV